MTAYRSKSERLREPGPKKSVERPVEYAEGGGSSRMFKQQTANPQRSGTTGKVQGKAPGAKYPEGGPKTSKGVSVAVPAKPGRTAPVREKGR